MLHTIEVFKPPVPKPLNTIHLQGTILEICGSYYILSIVGKTVPDGKNRMWTIISLTNGMFWTPAKQFDLRGLRYSDIICLVGQGHRFHILPEGTTVTITLANMEVAA